MPWCEECQKYWTPTAMTPEGKCPQCGRDIESATRETEEKVADEKAPWHFKLLVVALVVYLTWRFVQLLT